MAVKKKKKAPRYATGWMIVFRADMDAAADGIEDEAWTFIFRKLERAKEDCRLYVEDRIKAEELLGESDEIDWAEDQESDAKRRVYFGRPKANLEGHFQIYQVFIE